MLSLGRIVRRAVIYSPLARLALRYKEWQAGQLAEAPPSVDETGVPIPNAVLIATVVGRVPWREFIASGDRAISVFASAINRNGGNFAASRRVLDFGCGCGRLARHLPKHTSAEIYGVDYNGNLVGWCEKNLTGHYSQNGLHPPLDFEANFFDAIYLYSVFTHLREQTQRAWLIELKRILAPDGFCIITFHDEDQPELTHAGIDREELILKKTIVRNNNVEGSNLLSIFQTRTHAATVFSEFFDVMEIVPSQSSDVGQAMAILRLTR